MIDNDNNRAGPTTSLTRNDLFSGYMNSLGAKIKRSIIILEQDGTVYYRDNLKPISTLVYASNTNPRNKFYRDKMECLTITYKRIENMGIFPVSVTGYEKESHRVHIIVFDLQFDPHSPNYNESYASSLFGKLYLLEKKSCMNMAARLTLNKAVIYEYDVDLKADNSEISLETVTVEPYLESIFSSRYYDDEHTVFITWENTDAGWFPVMSSIDNTINRGFLITIPNTQDRNDKRETVPSTVRANNHNEVHENGQ